MKPIFFCLSLFSVLCGSVSAASVEGPRSHIIIIVMPHDVGYGDFACLGNPIARPPAPDAFWKESVRFTDFQLCQL